MKMKLLVAPHRMADLRERMAKAEAVYGADKAIFVALPQLGVMPPPACTSIRIVEDASVGDGFPALIAESPEVTTTP